MAEGLSGRRVCRESGWDLSFSRNGLRFHTYSYIHEGGSTPESGPMRGGRAGSALRRRWWLVPLILIPGSVTAGMLASPAKLPNTPYMVSVPVPDAPARTAHRPARLSRSHAKVTGSGAGRVAVHTSAQSALNKADAANAIAPELSEQRYTDIAMRTGEMQSWQAGEVRHFLVAGDLQRTDQGACRAFSLLTRSSIGGDTVRQFERCTPAD